MLVIKRPFLVTSSWIFSVLAALLVSCSSSTQLTQTAEPEQSVQPIVTIPNCDQETTSLSLRAYCLFNSAALLHQAGYREQAKQEYLRVLSIDEKYLHALIALGDIYYEEDELISAEKMYLSAIEIDPLNPTTFENLGVVYDNSGNIEKAITSYQEAIRLNSRNAELHYKLGIAYSRDRARLNEAINELKTAIELNPTNPRFHFDLGQIYEFLGRSHLARVSYQRALELGYSEASDKL